MTNNIYQKISQISKDQKITIRQLEAKTKIPHGTIQKWHHNAPIYRLILIADTLKVSVDELINHQNSNKPSEQLTRQIYQLAPTDQQLVQMVINRLSQKR